MKVAPSRGITRNKFAGTDFKLVDERTLICPAGHAMYPRERKVNQVGDLLVLFGINPRTCQQCPLRPQCHADGSKGTGGRRVTVVRERLAQSEQMPVMAADSPIASPPSLPPTANRAVVWWDIPSVQLRRGWAHQLRQHQIQIEQIQQPKTISRTPSKLITRHQRAHRRLSWQHRLKRNTCDLKGHLWRVQLHGIPQSITDALNHHQFLNPKEN